MECGVFQLPDVADGEQGVELNCSQLSRLLGGQGVELGVGVSVGGRVSAGVGASVGGSVLVGVRVSAGRLGGSPGVGVDVDVGVLDSVGV